MPCRAAREDGEERRTDAASQHRPQFRRRGGPRAVEPVPSHPGLGSSLGHRAAGGDRDGRAYRGHVARRAGRPRLPGRHRCLRRPLRHPAPRDRARAGAAVRGRWAAGRGGPGRARRPVGGHHPRGARCRLDRRRGRDVRLPGGAARSPLRRARVRAVRAHRGVGGGCRDLRRGGGLRHPVRLRRVADAASDAEPATAARPAAAAGAAWSGVAGGRAGAAHARRDRDGGGDRGGSRARSGSGVLDRRCRGRRRRCRRGPPCGLRQGTASA